MLASIVSFFLSSSWSPVNSSCGTNISEVFVVDVINTLEFVAFYLSELYFWRLSIIFFRLSISQVKSSFLLTTCWCRWFRFVFYAVRLMFWSISRRTSISSSYILSLFESTVTVRVPSSWFFDYFYLLRASSNYRMCCYSSCFWLAFYCLRESICS